MSFCDGHSCCPHPPENRAIVVRDGVALGICTECREEVPILSVPEPLPPLRTDPLTPEVGTTVPNLGTPCGEDVPHRWGGPL